MVQPLNIAGEFTTPEIRFNPTTGELLFSGASFPENVASFYEPLQNWINDYIQTNPEKITLIFKMAYINSASTKVLFELLLKMVQYQKQTGNLHVEWHYREDDEDIEETGIQYMEETGLVFKMVVV